MNINQVCMKCMMGKLNENGVCTSCGAESASENNGSMHLPVRTILKGKYLIGRVIGEGGFGITYIGYDLDLEIRVAIKEFCPKQYVGRESSDGLTIYPYKEQGAEIFEEEKKKFINEARRLAKFRSEAGVVSVLDYFRENGTTYIVMDYIDGITLKKYLKRLHDSDTNMEMAEVLKLFRPVMETLAKIHKENMIHRDISPENIMFSNDFKKVYLIDFGTARQTENGLTLSEYYKSFYTPIEQRSRQLQQGPWTDVYALCATIYVCITGRVLQESWDRMVEDNLVAPSEYGVHLPVHMEDALMKGLAIKAEDRIRSMEELMEAFYGDGAALQEGNPAVMNVETPVKLPDNKESNTNLSNPNVVSGSMTKTTNTNAMVAFEKRKIKGILAKNEKFFKMVRFLCCLFMIYEGFCEMYWCNYARLRWYMEGVMYGAICIIVWMCLTNIFSKSVSSMGFLTMKTKGSKITNVLLQIMVLPVGTFLVYMLFAQLLYFESDLIEDMVVAMTGMHGVLGLRGIIIYGAIWSALIYCCAKLLSNSIKKAIFPEAPTEGIVRLQIEAMGRFWVGYKGRFRERNVLKRADYVRSYLEHEGQRKHGCHKFLLPELTAYNFNRFDLLEYYDEIIFPSAQISEELKAEWLKAAKENWVLIEGLKTKSAN